MKPSILRKELAADPSKIPNGIYEKFRQYENGWLAARNDFANALVVAGYEKAAAIIRIAPFPGWERE